MAADDKLLTDLGFALPQGTEMIKYGDDAIRKNAAAAFTTGWRRWRIAPGTDLDTITEQGGYEIIGYSVALSLVNRPSLATAMAAAKLNVHNNTAGAVVQYWITLPAAKLESITLERHQDNGGTWSEWRLTGASTPVIPISKGTDLFSLAAGSYTVDGYGVATSLTNAPTLTAALGAATVEVISGPRGAKVIRWTSLLNATLESVVMQAQQDNAGSWSKWRRIDDIAPSTLATLQANGTGSTTASTSAPSRAAWVLTRGLARLMLENTTSPAPVWAWTAPEGDRLTIPTHEGSGQPCHPSLLYFPDKWNGWEYWMSHTPYPWGQEKHEDPNIVVSHDGTNWEVPAGLTNPLDDQTGKPNPYNSDSYLTMHPDGSMVCLWRMVDRPNNEQERYYWRTSRDGITWTPKREIYTPKLGTADGTSVAPSLLWLGDRWRMYVVRTVPSPNVFSYVESTQQNPGPDDWSAAVNCKITPGPLHDRDWWHCDVQRTEDGKWVAIMQDVARGTAGVDGDIYLMRSDDGKTWEISTIPLTPKAGNEYDTMYKTGFIPKGTGDDLVLDVFYTAFPRKTREFSVRRTTARAINR